MRKSISTAFFSLVSTLMVLGIVLMGFSEWVLYKGEDAVQYTYIITDYTDDSGNTLDNIRMNLIIVSGRIVGGDICSAALDGFMTGLQPRKN